MSQPQSHPAVHLVGSIPLGDAESVFRAVCAKVGPHLRRLPDGETGKRIDWIRFIQVMLSEHPDMEVDTETPPLQWRQWDGVLLREIPLVRFKYGTDLDKVVFEIGYAAAAEESFRIFDRLQGKGVIGPGVRFQICLPTVGAPGYNYVSPRAQPDFFRVFEPALLAEVDGIARNLPHDRIAIQWDVCQEVLMFEDYYDFRPDDYKEQILSGLARVGDAVPAGIDLGYHFCYGSPRNEHLLQPADLGIVVEMANGVIGRVGREIQFIHIPVPRDRADDAYFEPLAGLDRPDGCELFFGLIHDDDEAGDRARLERALAHVPVAGVSCECGWGRADPERVPGLLDSHVTALAHFGAKG